MQQICFHIPFHCWVWSREYTECACEDGYENNLLLCSTTLHTCQLVSVRVVDYEGLLFWWFSES